MKNTDLSALPTAEGLCTACLNMFLYTVVILLFINLVFHVLNVGLGCIDHITKGRLMDRGNQYIELVKVLY